VVERAAAAARGSGGGALLVQQRRAEDRLLGCGGGGPAPLLPPAPPDLPATHPLVLDLERKRESERKGKENACAARKRVGGVTWVCGARHMGSTMTLGACGHREIHHREVSCGEEELK